MPEDKDIKNQSQAPSEDAGMQEDAARAHGAEGAEQEAQAQACGSAGPDAAGSDAAGPEADASAASADEAGEPVAPASPESPESSEAPDAPDAPDATDAPDAPEAPLALTVKIRRADSGEGGQDADGKDQDRPSRGIPHPATIVFGIPAPGQAKRGEGAKEQEEEQPIPSIVPVVPVRDVVIFNYMFLPLFISRPSSAEAVQSAVGDGRHVLILTQRDEKEDEPKQQDLFSVGTVVKVLRMLRLPDGKLKVSTL